MIEHRIDLDLDTGGVPPVVHINQYDSGARIIKATIYSGGIPADLSGVTGVTVCGTKPSGTGFSYDNICTIDTSAGTISFDVTEQMTVVAGPVRCGLILTTADGQAGTLVFILDVQKAALTTETVVDSNDFNSLIPAVEIEDIAGGHRITITYADSAHTFDVMDGSDGKDGSDYILTDEDKAEIAAMAAAILEDLDAGGLVDLLAEAVRTHPAITQAVRELSELIDRLIVIGEDEPDNGPVLWFDTRSRTAPETEPVVILRLGGDGDETPVKAEFDGREYPVKNASEPTYTADQTYEIEISN